MKDEFEYGERVEVRNDGGKWVVRKYIGIKYFTRVNTWDYEHQEWDEIRKLPEHTATEDLIEIEQPETIEQRMDKFEAILNGAIKHINEQIQSIKEQIK
jgi:hypothetical protein